MMRARWMVVAWVWMSSAIAHAQPAVDPAADPSAPPLAPVFNGPPGGAQLVAPLETERDPWAAHRGVTVEVNVGVGFERVSAFDGGDGTSSQAGFGGLDFSIGGFIRPRFALEFRIAGVNAHIPDISSDRIINGFYGVELQYWATERLWFGGGLGLGLFGNGDTGCPTSSGKCEFGGGALDLRVGVTVFQHQRQSMNLSLEIDPARYSNDGQTWTATSSAVLLGYQFL